MSQPPPFVLPPDGVHIRWPDDWLGQERRTLTIKHPGLTTEGERP
jgi:indolepyruvate ferredoxin oxidoreductase